MDKKLYILKRKPFSGNMWDEVAQMVVRADNAKQARELAAEEALAEGGDVWLHTSTSSCQELTAEGKSKVIIMDER